MIPVSALSTVSVTSHSGWPVVVNVSDFPPLHAESVPWCLQTDAAWPHGLSVVNKFHFSDVTSSGTNGH